jgi:hypothetical protein
LATPVSGSVVAARRRLRLGDRDRGDDEHDPRHGEPAGGGGDRPDRREDDQPQHVDPGRTEREEVRGVEADPDDRRAQAHDAHGARRPPGQQREQPAAHRDRGMDRPPARACAQHPEDHPAGQPDAPDREQQPERTAGVHRPDDSDQAQEAGHAEEDGQQRHGRPAVGVHGGHPAAAGPARR